MRINYIQSSMNEMRTAERVDYDACCATWTQRGTDKLRGVKGAAKIHAYSNVYTLVGSLFTPQFHQSKVTLGYAACIEYHALRSSHHFICTP